MFMFLQKATFQLLLLTDISSYRTYTVFIYSSIHWITQMTTSQGYQTEVVSGVKQVTYNLPTSLTTAALTVAKSPGNLGKLIFPYNRNPKN